MSRRKVSLSQKIRNHLADGKSPKEIAALLKCDPQKVYSVKYHMRRKQEGIAALPTKKPDDLMPVTKEEVVRPGSVVETPVADQSGFTVVVAVLVAVAAVAAIVLINAQ